MCIYCGTNNYRGIFTKHHGPIPKDENNRSYDIHHIDGNHSNNDPSNLKAVTINEHYDIHHANGDYGACIRIGWRINKSPEELSELARQNVKQQVANGTHNFVGGEIQRRLAKKRIQEGSHTFLDSEAQKARAKKRVEDGTHHMLGGGIQRENAKRLVENGTHPMMRVRHCEHCGRDIKGLTFNKFHGEKCKMAKNG